MTSRRAFLSTSAAALSATAMQPARPNVLFIMVDEMRWDALSAEQHPVVQTPNLDRLARQGVRFSNAYTVAPVCSPSRACTFTGRYADVNGVTANGIPANQGEVFLPSIMRHHGYHTAIAGKLHYTPRRFDYGFDQFWSFSAEGPTPELGHSAYLQRKHGKGAAKWAIADGTCPWPDDPLGRDVGIFRYPDEDFETEWLTERSIDYLRSRKEKAQPWFLFTSYLKPHSPSVEPKRWFEKYDPNAIPVPNLPANIKELRAAQQGRGKRQFIDDERMLRVMSAAYYGAIAHVDQQVGRLLAELDKLGMADNTIVLFTADHGNMLGDRGRMFKSVMYEGSSHVPLIWRGVKGARENSGRVEKKIVENTDLMPAIFDACGLPLPDRMQGRSFVKLMRGGDSAWKDRCYSQLRTAMVRDSRLKFIDNSRSLSGEFELYDMQEDPKEQRNLVAEVRHRDRVEDYKRQLTEWRADKPAPVKVSGMATPAYAQISEAERKEAVENAPDRVERPVRKKR
ncbi:MAG: sulfatase-like hydrolase/transferase [Bryobacterales bacterium]|nr:sulfatase-like hydrolase/transferase [Bryobacterales bacterium]